MITTSKICYHLNSAESNSPFHIFVELIKLRRFCLLGFGMEIRIEQDVNFVWGRERERGEEGEWEKDGKGVKGGGYLLVREGEF